MKCSIRLGKMPEEITADSVSKQQPVDNSQKLILNLLGSGKSADVLLWSNKTISTDVLAAITVIWVVFRLLCGCFFSLLCYALMLKCSKFTKQSPSEPPHLVLPDELFVNIAKSVGVVINLAFGSFQDVACRGNIKQFLGWSVIFTCNFMEVTELTLGKSLQVVASLWAAAVIARRDRFVASHTLPVLYERNKD
ncbi:unnamed protein product [Camellia sinensis]